MRKSRQNEIEGERERDLGMQRSTTELMGLDGDG